MLQFPSPIFPPSALLKNTLLDVFHGNNPKNELPLDLKSERFAANKHKVPDFVYKKEPKLN